MILAVHIAIALSSMGYTTYLYFNPAPEKFGSAYWLIGATIGSGTYLVVSSGAHLLKACLSGLFYLGVVLGAIALARKKMAHERTDV